MKPFLTSVFLLLLLSNCTIQNNLYLNNPMPLGKGYNEAYIGASTGLRPQVDSVSTDGTVFIAEEFGSAPNLNVGAHLGLGERTNLGIDLHLPYGFGGAGIQLRPQFSFFNRDSKFQMAVSARVGFVASKDSIKIGRFSTSIEDQQIFRGGLNADIALPLAYQIDDEAWVILTPRLATNRVRYWEIQGDLGETRHFNYNFTALSLGLRYRRVHFEVSAHQLDNRILPTFGVVYIGEID